MIHTVKAEAGIASVELAAVTQTVELEPMLQIGEVTSVFPTLEAEVFPAVEAAEVLQIGEVKAVFPAVEAAVFPDVEVAVAVQDKHHRRPKTQKVRKRCAQKIPQSLPDSLPIRCCPNYDSSNRSCPSCRCCPSHHYLLDGHCHSSLTATNCHAFQQQHQLQSVSVAGARAAQTAPEQR